MATAAQIAANQLNALKSTGPKTQKGKQISSANARRHGLNGDLPAQDVLAAYQTITGMQVADLSNISNAAMRLAIAEAQLARAKERERKLLARGDDDVRQTWYFDMIDDAIMQEIEDLGRVSIKTNLEAAELQIRGAKVFGKSTQQTYRSLRRALREAENAHASALSNWLDEV